MMSDAGGKQERPNPRRTRTKEELLRILTGADGIDAIPVLSQEELEILRSDLPPRVREVHQRLLEKSRAGTLTEREREFLVSGQYREKPELLDQLEDEETGDQRSDRRDTEGDDSSR